MGLKVQAYLESCYGSQGPRLYEWAWLALLEEDDVQAQAKKREMMTVASS